MCYSYQRKLKGGKMWRTILLVIGILFLGTLLYLSLKINNIINEYVIGSVLKTKNGNSGLFVPGVNYEKIEFPASDGAKIIGWFIPSQDKNAPGVIVSSGFLYDRNQVVSKSLLLSKFGYNLLVFDPRGQGESPGVYALGSKEPEDIEGAINWMHQRGIKKIAILGYSCGATAAIIAASRHPKEISAIVVDSPIANFHYLGGKLVRSVIGTSLVFPIYNLVARIRLGYNIFQRTDALKVVNKVSHILFIHGKQDGAVSYQSSLALYKKAKEPKEIWLVNDANHVEAGQFHPEEYKKRVLGFLEKYLGK